MAEAPVHGSGIGIRPPKMREISAETGSPTISGGFESDWSASGVLAGC
jgi:hypothetical protein